MLKIQIIPICSALSELFDKADSSRDGKISIKEYVDMCETYGVELRDEDIREVLEIADEHGEVHRDLAFNVLRWCYFSG